MYLVRFLIDWYGMCVFLVVYMNVIEIFVRYIDNFNYIWCMYINNILYMMKKIIYLKFVWFIF